MTWPLLPIFQCLRGFVGVKVEDGTTAQNPELQATVLTPFTKAHLGIISSAVYRDIEHLEYNWI